MDLWKIVQQSVKHNRSYSDNPPPQKISADIQASAGKYVTLHIRVDTHKNAA